MASEPHRWPVRVYYEDTDAAGIVYYASYLRFAERARTEMLRALGIGQEEMRRVHGLGFVVRRLEVDYPRPARLDDELVIETRPLRIGAASLDLQQLVRRGDELLTRLVVQVALVDDAGRPKRLPSVLRERLSGLGPVGP